MLFDLVKYASKVAFYLDDGRQVSYGALAEAVAKFQRNLKLGKGLFLLEADNSLNTMIAYLAALQSRCPVVLVEAGDVAVVQDIKTRFSILYHYCAPSGILGSAEQNPGIEINPKLALMLSTSGSTGTPKFVCLSRENLRSNSVSIAEYLDLSSADCAPTNLPFFYSYGMSVVNSHLMVGGSLWLTDQSVMDQGFWPRFDELACTSFAGVPHTYEMLDKINFRTADRKSLRYCTQAGGKLSQELIVKNAQAAKEEGWQFFVMYGQTEASPRIAYLPPEQALMHPDCIGIPVPGGGLSLLDESGADVDACDVVGELVYRGANVMMDYATGDRDLALKTSESRLETGDMACRNSDGLFYIVGRKSRFLKLFGKRTSLDAVEAFLATHKIKAVCGGTDECLGILAVSLDDTEPVREKVAKWLGVPLFAVRVFGVGEVPLRSNGKTDYTQASALLRTYMESSTSAVSLDLEQAVSHAEAVSSLSLNEALLAGIYSQAIGGNITDASVSLRQAGADSLSIVHVLLDLEKHIPEIPEDWMDLPIRELATRVSGKRRPVLKRMFSMQSVEAFVVLRALAIFCVVAHHFNWFAVPGGTTTLLFVIGGYLYCETHRDVLRGRASPSRLWSGLIILASTLIPLSVVMAGAHSWVGNDWHATLLLPYENLSSYFTDLSGVEDRRHHVHWLWFIHVYLQIFFLIALSLSFASVRRQFARHAFEKVLLLFFLSEAVAALLILLDSGRQDLGHSAALLQYAPTTLFPVVLFGALISLRQTPGHSRLIYIAGMSYAVLYGLGVFTQGGLAALLAVGVLLLARTLLIPGFMFLPVMLLSEASLFIYLTHKPLEFAVKELLQWSVSPPVLVFGVLVIAIALWPIWRSLTVIRVRQGLQRWINKEVETTTSGPKASPPFR